MRLGLVRYLLTNDKLIRSPSVSRQGEADEILR